MRKLHLPSLAVAGPLVAQATTTYPYGPVTASETVKTVPPATSAVSSTFLVGWVIVWAILSLVGFALWLWALIDVIRRQFPPGSSDKILWIIVILLVPLIGPILYLIVGRQRGSVGTPPETPSQQ